MAFGGFVEDLPHEGRMALPHFHPRNRTPENVHAFFEAPPRHARKRTDMRYFTPELLARCRSLDEDVAEAAAEEWEKATTEYRTRLNAIRSHLPQTHASAGSRQPARLEIIAFEFGKRPTFSILLQLEGEGRRPGKMMQLSYHVVAGEHGGVKTQKHAQPGQATQTKSWILYDELNMDEERASFTHSLLLSDGREIEVRFHNLRVRSLEEVVTPPELAEQERHWRIEA